MRLFKSLICAILCTLFTSPLHAAVFINEFHYDNAGMDLNEGIEIAGMAGTDISGYHLLLYNGSTGSVYRDILLEGTISAQSDNYGALFFSTSLQNGPDGIALTNAGGEVLEFISYEGSFTASSGAAIGMSSVDIGVFQATTGDPNMSLQLAGSDPNNFSWILDSASSGQLNAQQDFATPVPVPSTLPLLATALVALRWVRRT